MKFITNAIKRIWNRKTLVAAATLTGKKMSIEGLTPEVKVAVKIARERQALKEKFITSIKHTSGLTMRSQAVAYDKAFDDVITLLIPDPKPSIAKRAKALLTGQPAAA